MKINKIHRKFISRGEMREKIDEYLAASASLRGSNWKHFPTTSTMKDEVLQDLCERAEIFFENQEGKGLVQAISDYADNKISFAEFKQHVDRVAWLPSGFSELQEREMVKEQ